MIKRLFGLAIALAFLVLWRPVPVAYGQLPTGPKTAFKSTFSVTNPPSQFEVVEDVVDFAPGSWTPPHVHGGPAFITVAQGELTYRSNGTDKTFKAGETWTENPGDVMQIGNVTSSPARTLVTFLLPKGAQLTTAQEVAATQLPVAIQPKKSETKFAVSNPPAQFDLIEVQQDFAPGAVTPVHTHGGPAYITMLSGQLTLRGNGKEKVYSAGESWSESPGEFMQVVNNGTKPSSTFVTFLLPKGAALTTNQQQEAPLTSTPSTPIWLFPSLGVAAAVILGGGALLIRRRFGRR